MLGLLGLRIFEPTTADIADLGEEHGHRVLHVCGKGSKIVLLQLPPAVGRPSTRPFGSRTRGPILLNSRGARTVAHFRSRVRAQPSIELATSRRRGPGSDGMLG